MSEAENIVVVGSVALDTIETPWGAAEDCLGGSASYASLAAGLFAPVRLVAVVGSDLPSRARDLFAARQVDTSGLEVVEGRTFRWGGRYHENMNRRDTLFTELNVFEHFHPKLPSEYLDSEIVFLANIHPALQHEVLDQVDSPKLVALDTMNLWIETARADLEAVLRKVDLLFVNDEEAQQLSGHANLWRAVDRLREMGPRTVIVKKGEHGALLFTENGLFALPAVLLEKVFDPTGAGDAFAGAFLGYVARQGDYTDSTLRHAMIHGTVTASFVTERFGTDRLAETTLRDVEERMSQLRADTQWPEPLRL